MINLNPPKLKSPQFPNVGVQMPGGGGYQFNPGKTGFFNNRLVNNILNKKKFSNFRSSNQGIIDQLRAGERNINLDNIAGGRGVLSRLRNKGNLGYNPSITFNQDKETQGLYDKGVNYSSNLLDQGFTELDPQMLSRIDQESQAAFDRSANRLTDGFQNRVGGILQDLKGSGFSNSGAASNVFSQGAIKPFAQSLSDLSLGVEADRRSRVDSALANQRAAFATPQSVNSAYINAGGQVPLETMLNQGNFISNYGLQRDQQQLNRYNAGNQAAYWQAQLDAATKRTPFQDILGTAAGALPFAFM